MKNVFRLFGLFVLLNSITACEKCQEEPPIPPPAFPLLSLPPINPPIPWTEITTDSSEANGVLCKTQEVEWGPQYLDVISLNPQEGVVFPGAVFNYETFQTGTYQPIVGNRRPITFSASLPGSGVSLTRTVEEPTLSAVREALNDMLSPYTGVTPANLSFTSKKILSEKHFSLAVGGNLKSGIFDIAAHFDFQNSEIKSRLLIEFTQVYYSIDLDTPQPGLENWFEEALDNEDQLGAYSPVYVSSVRYGRKVFVLIESKTLSYDQMASLNTNFNGVLHGGSLVADQTMSKLLEESSIQVAVMGGAAATGINLITDIDKFNEYLQDGANYSSQSPGVPLSYTLNFITNNDIAKLQLYDKFKIVECFPNIVDIEVPDLTNLCPQLLNGDGEFASNGPNIDAKVWLATRNSNKELWAHVTFTLKETAGGDDTEGAGSWEMLVYTAPENRKIHSVLTSYHAFPPPFEDTDDGLNTLNFSSDDLVRKIEIMGDTAGIDLGECDANHSFISVYFNPVQVKLY